jgi:uncharacterized membrane protein
VNKSEFLKQLSNSLNGKISYSEIQERIEFYNNYIDEEILKGKKEEEVLEELGSPRLIAKSILDSLGYADMPYENTYESKENQGKYNSEYKNYNDGDLVNRFNKGKVLKWYEKALIVAIIALILILFLLLSTIVLNVVFTFGPAILIIILIIYLLKK